MILTTLKHPVLGALLWVTACTPPPKPQPATPDAGTQPECRVGTVYQTNGPAFAARSAEWGLEDIHGSALTVVDLNGDGWQDLLVLDAADMSTMKSRAYLNTALNGRRVFVDFTQESGIFAFPGGFRAPAFATSGDVDNDGDADLLLGAWNNAAPTCNATTACPTGWTCQGTQCINGPAISTQTTVLLNDGQGHFQEVVEGPLLGQPALPLTSQGLFVDQDHDGNLDVFTTYWYKNPPGPFQSYFGDQPNIWLGDGAGGFVEQGLEKNILLTFTTAAVMDGTGARPVFGGAACDVNGDGYPDLMATAYARMWNLLWESTPQGSYQEVGRASGFAGDERVDPATDQSFICWCKANAGICPQAATLPNPVYQCPIRGWQPGVSDHPAFLNGNTFSVACGDVDDDGDMDLYTGEIRHPDVGDVSDPSELLINETTPGGPTRFTRPGRQAMGLEPGLGQFDDEGGQNSSLFDFDNDGRLDVFLGASPYPRSKGWMFRQVDTLQFEFIGENSGFFHACPHGVALADIDHDGDEDLIVGTYGCNDPNNDHDYEPPTNQPVVFYENVSNTNNWLLMRLVGTGAARDAFGAKVRVTTGGVTRTREVHNAWGRVALSRELAVHVGLGAACNVDRVEITWPDRARTVQVFENVHANQAVEIRQGDNVIRRVR